jgi:trimeric autotransporter adhesin
MRGIQIVVLIGLIGDFTRDLQAAPFGTAFNYQGRLSSGTNASNGVYDFQFSLWDSAGSGATLFGATQAVNGVSVSNGYFTATIDFGAGAFNGEARWLEVDVRTNGAVAFDALSPRQNLMPTPYAITASNLSGTLPAGQLSGTLPNGLLSGTYSNAVTFNNPGNAFAGNGAGLTGVDALTLGGYNYCTLPCYWNLNGNGGTTAGANFLGTTDNQPLELRVNRQRAFRLEPTTNCPNVIGGFAGNRVTNIAVGVTIGGGGAVGMTNLVWMVEWDGASPLDGQPSFGTIGGGAGNAIFGGNYATIGGGIKNEIDNSHRVPVSQSTIGGGASNSVKYAQAGTIAGGSANQIFGDSAGGGWANYATIGGGHGNVILDTVTYTADCTIAGGASNIVAKTEGATIGGGFGNSIITEAWYATIAGGLGNFISFTANSATIAGGRTNVIDYYARGATIGGGGSNYVCSDYGAYNSFATIPGGWNNSATNFAFAAGYRAKALSTGAFVWADHNEFDFPSTNANSFSVRAVGGTRFVSGIDGSGNPTAGVILQPGAGSWTTLSDRNAKENVKLVSGREVLERLDTIPIATWNYKAQDKSIRHIGPMAQDFAAAFKVGEDDHGISTVDADGVALAAIQGLHQEITQKDARIQTLEKDVAQLKELVSALVKKETSVR